jgi:hypothetical protein
MMDRPNRAAAHGAGPADRSQSWGHRGRLLSLIGDARRSTHDAGSHASVGPRRHRCRRRVPQDASNDRPDGAREHEPGRESRCPPHRSLLSSRSHCCPDLGNVWEPPAPRTGSNGAFPQGRSGMSEGFRVECAGPTSHEATADVLVECLRQPRDRRSSAIQLDAEERSPGRGRLPRGDGPGPHSGSADAMTLRAPRRTPCVGGLDRAAGSEQVQRPVVRTGDRPRSTSGDRACVSPDGTGLDFGTAAA